MTLYEYQHGVRNIDDGEDLFCGHTFFDEQAARMSGYQCWGVRDSDPDEYRTVIVRRRIIGPWEAS